MSNKRQELVSVAEIAELAGVSKQLVHNWARRSRDMPKPLVRLKCGPIWDGGEIRRWLVTIGYTHLKSS